MRELDEKIGWVWWKLAKSQRVALERSGPEWEWAEAWEG